MALQRKKGVCQDYVFLSLALLRAAGIPSRFVEGTAGGQAHAWVESKLGNRWIIMDPTWGSGYIMGGEFVKKFDDSYFNPSIKKLSKTHKRIGIIY
jgi:transglutaminase/protease-like cytokinesis protein 3